MIPLKIIFEDDDFLIIDKPSGIVVNKAETVKEKTIQDIIREKLNFDYEDKDNNSDFGKRCGIIHRLDKETSGLLLIAKNPESFFNLQRQFKERTIEKKYFVLVHGYVKPKRGKIEAPIERNPFNREKFGVFLGGRDALTEYHVLSYFLLKEEKSDEILTFISVLPKTGRTHQIRVHFKYLNYPLFADKLYLGRKRLKKDLKYCQRIFLHAFYLKFTHPIKKQELIFVSSLPLDLKNFLKKLILIS